MKYFLTILCFIISCNLFCQLSLIEENKVDSLKSIISLAKHDSTIINAWKEWADIIYNTNPDLELELNTKIEKISKTNLNNKISPQEKIYYERNYCFALNKIGSSYYIQGNFSKAITYYTRGLKKSEEMKDKKRSATFLNNIGNIYKDQGEHEKALEYYDKSLKLKKELNNPISVGSTLNNIGLVYQNKGDYSKAIDYFNQSLEIDLKSGDELALSSTLNNIGYNYALLKDHQKALEFYNRTLQIVENIGDKKSIAITLNNIGNLYFEKGDYSKAINFSLRALKNAQDADGAIEMTTSSESLFKNYKKIGDYKNALLMHELFIRTRDSILSEENRNEVIRQELNYEYEKQSLADSIINAEERKTKNIQLSKQKAIAEKQETELENKRYQQYILFGGLSILIIFLIFVYNRFRVTNKQKKIIELQKSEVERQKHIVEIAHSHLGEKNKEILDSINYAKRLQHAILATKDEIDKYLSNNFLLYKPKDIVAGDFYFFEVTEEYIFYAAADSTGHGVPGAMVSIVCSNALTRSVKEFNLSEPGKILDQTRKIILETFQKSGEDVKDGMDISLVAINRTKREIKWAGANNPLWYIENNEMKEITADKQPIGKTDNPKPFTTHTLPFSLSTLFLFTDGYADQFGGPKGKKFKYANLQKLLLENHLENSQTQINILEKTFIDWKNDLEQVDDVCIIGIKI